MPTMVGSIVSGVGAPGRKRWVSLASDKPAGSVVCITVPLLVHRDHVDQHNIASFGLQGGERHADRGKHPPVRARETHEGDPVLLQINSVMVSEQDTCTGGRRLGGKTAPVDHGKRATPYLHHGLTPPLLA